MTINFKGGISSIGGISTGPEIVAGPGPFAPNAADFDGSDDRLFHTGALSTITDSKQGLVSVWFKPTIDNQGRFIHISTEALGTFAKFDCTVINSKQFAIAGRTASGTLILLTLSNSTFTTADVWTHALASWDLSTGAVQMYIDNVEDREASPIAINDTINYSLSGDTAVGAESHPADLYWNGCLAELYFTNEFLNLDDPDNRAKFISGGIPVDLGSNGSTPTGTQPILYFSGDGTAFPTNLGSGGSFVVEGGGLANCADGPSLA